MVVIVNPKSIRPFASEAAFEAWLSKHHDRNTEVWIKIFKKATGKPTVTPAQAIDVALCWGWIDGIRKALDERAFLQRYTPRGSKSRWSQINRGNVQRLVKAGRMTPAGQRHVTPPRPTVDGTGPTPRPATFRSRRTCSRPFRPTRGHSRHFVRSIA